MSLQVNDAEDAIANGRRFYNAKQYRPALEQFTIVGSDVRAIPLDRASSRY